MDTKRRWEILFPITDSANFRSCGVASELLVAFGGFTHCGQVTGTWVSPRTGYTLVDSHEKIIVDIENSREALQALKSLKYRWELVFGQEELYVVSTGLVEVL